MVPGILPAANKISTGTGVLMIGILSDPSLYVVYSSSSAQAQERTHYTETDSLLLDSNRAGANPIVSRQNELFVRSIALGSAAKIMNQ